MTILPYFCLFLLFNWSGYKRVNFGFSSLTLLHDYVALETTSLPSASFSSTTDCIDVLSTTNFLPHCFTNLINNWFKAKILINSRNFHIIIHRLIIITTYVSASVHWNMNAKASVSWPNVEYTHSPFFNAFADGNSQWLPTFLLR